VLSGKNFTKSVRERFATLTKEVFGQIIDTKINDGIRERDRQKEKRAAEAHIVETVNTAVSDTPSPYVLEWFNAVRGALLGVCKPSDLGLRKITAGYDILWKDSNRNPVARLIEQGGKMFIGVTSDDPRQSRDFTYYDGLASISPQHVEKMIAAVKSYTGKHPTSI
jgi:hypothetical protein